MALRQIDMGGNTLVVDGLRVGATAPGQAGTELTGTEITYLDGLTPGTATASKAVVLDSSKGIATITSATITTLTSTTIAGGPTFSVTPTLGTGTTINLDSNTATTSSNAATITKYAVVVTTESLTTAAGSSQALTLTLAGVAAGDLAFVTGAGGGNTREHIAYKAITSTNTVTVTVSNIGPTNALNGTLIFNLWVLKA